MIGFWSGINMVKVSTNSVSDGLIPAEKIALIEGVDGSIEELAVSSQDIAGNSLYASEIGRGDGKVLVEFPRESASGKWRIWVKEQAVTAGA
jgi:hypothetical protein